MRVVLERIYKSTFECSREWPKRETCDANFSVVLECDRDANVFHMAVCMRDSFLNNAINVCNWPVREWTLDQVRECVRIFKTEYVPGCKQLSELVDDKFLVDTRVLVVVDGGVIKRMTDSGDDVASAMWRALIGSAATTSWVDECIEYYMQRPDDEHQFAVCDSIHDLGYTEDPFPFVGAKEVFGNPIPSFVEFYQEHLPTLWALASKTQTFDPLMNAADEN